MEHGHDEMTNSEKMMWKMKRREHMAIRLLAAVIVFVFVFWCGFELGEIRASIGLDHGYGDRMMIQQGGWTVHPTVYNGAMPTTTVAPSAMTAPAQGTATK